MFRGFTHRMILLGQLPNVIFITRFRHAGFFLSINLNFLTVPKIRISRIGQDCKPLRMYSIKGKIRHR
jgi:hypothetical protein